MGQAGRVGLEYCPSQTRATNRPPSLFMKPTVALLTAFVVLSFSPGLRAGEEDELHARLEALEQKARAARDAGQLDLLEKLRAEMQQVKQGSPEKKREALTETLQNLENKANEYKARLAEAEKSDQPDRASDA